MSVFEADIAEEIRAALPGTDEVVVQYISGYLMDLDDAAEDEDVLQVTQTILESAAPSSSRSDGNGKLEMLMEKLGKILEEPLQKRAEKNKAGTTNGLVRLDRVMDMSKTAMSNTIAFGEGVDLESINKGK
jgi:ATP-binding cassette, subfamily F, member 3